MDDLIIIGVIVLILGLATWYVIRSKKRGKKCIGCPDSCNCDAGKCSGCCSSCAPDDK